MSNINTITSLVFIDSAVEDAKSLAAGTVPGAQAIILAPTQDGVEQISSALAERTGISSLHIVSHGSPGSLQLGCARLSNDTIGQYISQLQRWGARTTADAGILIYGCNVAAGEIGKAFVKRLSLDCGVPVAASAHKTGSAAKGGDWHLEHTTGTIKTGNAFSPVVMAAYSGVFAAEDDEWIRKLGSAGDDRSTAAAVDSAGNVYITGTTTGDLAGSNAGGEDAWLAKYDALGNQVWVRQFGTAGDESPNALGSLAWSERDVYGDEKYFDYSTHAILLDSAGNIYIKGRTKDSLGGSNDIISDIWLAKYDSSGTELWVKHFGSVNDQLPSDMTVDSAGNVYVVTYTKGDALFIPVGMAGAWSVPYNFSVTKYDSSGNEVWGKQFEEHTVTSFRIIADIADNVLIEGSSYSEEDIVDSIVAPWQPYRRWCVKYDSSGNQVPAPSSLEPSVNRADSDSQIGQLFYDDSNASSDSAGNTYQMGLINEQTDYAFAVKYDSRQNPQWVQLLAIPGDGEGAKGTADSAGNVYLTGLINGDWTGSTAGGSDVWVAKLVESNDANTGPALANSINLPLDKGASVPITSSELASADAGGDPITFRAGVLPTFGTLMLNNTPLTVNRTFTREDIDAGNLTYTHDGNETIADMFSFNATDGSSGNISTTTFLMSVSPASDPPVVLSLINREISNNWVTENSPAGTVISALTATDKDGSNLGIYQYTLLDDAGGRFTLDGYYLTVADGTLLDYETATSHTIRVRATPTDLYRSRFSELEKDFTIQVTDINENPAGNLEFIRELEGERKMVADGAGNVYLIGLDNSGWPPVQLLKYEISGTELQSADLGSAGEDMSSYNFAVDGAGNVWVAGEGQLAKYDSSGTQLWVKLSPDNWAKANVIADGAGNFYVAGITALGDGWQYEIIKYDSSGTELWVKELGTALTAYESFNLAVDSSGSVYFSADEWMAKYDSSANPVWLKPLGSESSDIAVDSAGNIYIAGNTSSGIGRWSGGLGDAWVAKYDTNGTELWVDHLGNPGRRYISNSIPSGNDSSSGIAVDSDGNVYITGLTEDYLGGINTGKGGVWVAKYGALGNQMWVKQFGNEGYSVSSDIAVDSAGKIYLTGFDGYYSEWVAKLDSNPGSNTPPALANNTGLSVGKGGSAAITPSELMAQDADGNTLMYTVTAPPANGTLRLNSDYTLWAGRTFKQSQIDAGLLSYTHSGSETASDSFSFTVTDFNSGNISTTTFPISVNLLNSPPTLASPISDFSTGPDEAFSYQLPEGTVTDSDAGDSISYSATLASGATLPPWLTFDPTTRTFSGTPSNANAGTLSILVRATDTAGNSVTDTFDLTVSVTVPPPVAGDTGTLPEDAVPPPAAGNTGTAPAAGNTGTAPAAGNTGTTAPAGDTGSPNPNPVENAQIGSDSNDTFTGGEGVDIFAGNQGADFLSGGGGNDLLFGNQDDDFLDGGIGDDTLHGGKGSDTVIGSGGNDILCGDRGADSLTGSEGNDLLFGNAGADSLDGSEGNDTLMGGKGNDSLTGGAGDDFLCGNRGSDTLTGGTGTDVFILTEGFDSDIVADFSDSLDVLGLTGTLTFEQLSVSAGAGATLISVAATGELLASLTGVSAHLIGVEDFAAY